MKRAWSTQELSQVKQQELRRKHQELRLKGQLEYLAREKKKEERDFEKLKELEKESTKLISTAMDKWIHNQGWLT